MFIYAKEFKTKLRGVRLKQCHVGQVSRGTRDRFRQVHCIQKVASYRSLHGFLYIFGERMSHTERKVKELS